VIVGSVKVVLNGREVTPTVPVWSYAQMARLAGQVEPTITWRLRDGRAGSVTAGETLRLVDGMILDVVNTGSA
jgi:hypothetical protein